MENIVAGRVDEVFLRCVEDCLEPIMLTDKSGKLTYVNPAWISTYGYSKKEAIGQTPRLLRSSLQGEEFYKKIWATILDPSIGFWKGELSNRAKDGHLVPVLLTITPYREASGHIVGYMGIAMDLSEQKKMEVQILHQDRMASIGMLAGGLAHEIGNPLGIIRGRAELFLNQIKNSEISKESAEKNVSIIISQIDRISGLIQSLMRVSRIPDTLPLTSINLAKSVQEVITLTSEECRRSEIKMETRDLDFEVLADPGQLQQLLLNVILNAIHAIEDQRRRNPDGRQRDFIEIFGSEGAGEHGRVLSVRDSGCGIDRENLDKLFKPFFTTKEVGKGTGLGLTIVAKMVEEVGGKISVESEGVGRGARFNFHFKPPPHLSPPTL